jgi:MoaA/NifB/PqqE/SkfB family radical SAM enzyme
MDNRQASYTAASVLPAKLVTNTELISEIQETKKIRPIHIQLNPTNVCNLDCPFCSCANRKKTEQLSYEYIMEIMKKAKDVGCESITITGGGEPTTHPDIEKIIQDTNKLGIEIGLVTNGTLLEKLSSDCLDCITWIRISSGDHREFTLKYKNSLENAVSKGRNVDWAFSHVITKKPNYETLRKIIKFANDHVFTHVRIVTDLLDLEKVPSMEEVRHNLRMLGTDDNLVIYQGRKKYERGTKRCLISLLKPVITPDGKIVACCGWQYRKYPPSKDYDTNDALCDAIDIDKLYEDQAHFDGSSCSRCYYMDYNRALEILLSDMKHREFV